MKYVSVKNLSTGIKKTQAVFFFFTEMSFRVIVWHTPYSVLILGLTFQLFNSNMKPV